MDVSFFLLNLLQLLTESIVDNPLLTAMIVILTLFDFTFGFVEFLDHARSIKFTFKAIALTVAAIALCIYVKAEFALLIMVIAVFLMILYSARKRTVKKNHKVKEIIGDAEMHFPSNSGLTTSLEYKLAEECIAKECPREAIAHLLQCRGKITGKPRYLISYADALLQLNNFYDALAKLNTIPSNRVKKRKTFINVTTRKARCYHGLHEYTKELACYDDLIAKNIQPEVYYFRRSQVKLRMLEVAPYLTSVEQAITNSSSSRQDFIEGIFNDLDKAQHYSKQDSEQREGRILSYKGACYIHTKAYQKGWEVLMEAQKKNEFYATTYVYLGIYQYDKKNPSQAIGEMRKAISCDKEVGAASDVACYYLAKIYYEMGEYDSAIRYATQSLSIFSCRSDCFRIQGKCYSEKLMYTEAIKCYTKAIELKPEAQYYASRAYCYYNRNGESRKAYYDMQEAIKLNDSSNYQIKALLYKADMDEKNNTQKDKAELNGLLAPFQNDPDNFVDLGIIYSKYQYFEESQQYYRKAIEKYPKSRAAHYDLALVLRELKLNDEAIEEFNIAIELDPMDVKIYRALANCYRDMGDPLNEGLILSRLSEVNQAHCDINKNNGDAVYQLNKYKAAVSYYQAALAYCPSPAVLNNLACAYYAQELYEEAIESLKKAIKLDTQYFPAYFNLGNCQLRMSEKGFEQDMEKKARENFEIAVSLNTEFDRASLMLNSMDTENIEMLIDIPAHR